MTKTFAIAASLAALSVAAMMSAEDIAKLTAQETAMNNKNAFAAAFEISQIEERDKYPTFYEAMNKYMYDWEAVEVTTEDGYILTMFHITGKTGYDWYKPTRPDIPVIVMHALIMDGTSWFDIYKDEFGNSENIPLPAALFDAGFDVWIPNHRGT